MSPCPRLWAVSRAPVIPVALTTGPFNLEEARRHGLTKDHLLGATWQRLGGGFYALRDICHDPHVVLAATSRRLPITAVFSGRTAGWLHGLDLPPCDPVEVTLPLGSHIAVDGHCSAAFRCQCKRDGDPARPSDNLGSSHARRPWQASPARGSGCGSGHGAA